MLSCRFQIPFAFWDFPKPFKPSAAVFLRFYFAPFFVFNNTVIGSAYERFLHFSHTLIPAVNFFFENGIPENPGGRTYVPQVVRVLPEAF
jgi:hypothetical protein